MSTRRAVPVAGPACQKFLTACSDPQRRYGNDLTGLAASALDELVRSRGDETGAGQDVWLELVVWCEIASKVAPVALFAAWDWLLDRETSRRSAELLCRFTFDHSHPEKLDWSDALRIMKATYGCRDKQTATDVALAFHHAHLAPQVRYAQRLLEGRGDA